MGYAILQKEYLPESLKDKPRWVSCLVITTAILFITLSAIAVGAIFGYMYCYVEHRHGIAKGNLTHSLNYQIVVPYLDTEEAKYNRTLNGAIMSSILVTKILEYTHDLLDHNEEYEDQLLTIVPTFPSEE